MPTNDILYAAGGDSGPAGMRTIAAVIAGGGPPPRLLLLKIKAPSQEMISLALTKA